MKVKFANGVIKECSAPTEQKLFKSITEKTVGIGWMLHLKLIGLMTSTELDDLMDEENIKSLEFLFETENGEAVTLFKLEGYEKVSSSVIRYSEDTKTTYAEMQLSRGI